MHYGGWRETGRNQCWRASKLCSGVRYGLSKGENCFSVISGNVVSGKCYLEEKREELFYKGRKYIK